MLPNNPAGILLKGIFHLRFTLFMVLAVSLSSGCIDQPAAEKVPETAANSLNDAGANDTSSRSEAQADDHSGRGTTIGGKLLFSGAEEAASRFLGQATFGARRDEISRLADSGNDFSSWISRQIALEPTYHRALGDQSDPDRRMDVWWSAVVDHDDQLRQRMAWALSQILVISDYPTILRNHQPAMLAYYDLLVRHAFGNYRQLLEDVTLSLPMGIYLSMKDSRKYDANTGAHPDENYAREVMQLFTIGLWKLDQSGRRVLDNGKPITTYSQTDVEELARIFSGWGSADAFDWGADFSRPMKAWPAYHDSGEKHFLGHTFPAGQSAEQDMTQALDILFNHPNTGPFIAKQLIQRFVTSNPTPEYVYRVAGVFNDNGSGVRGDLAAVIRAILLDDEARRPRNADDSFGKLREPLLKVTHLWRNYSGKVKAGNYWRPERDFLQAPMRSPTVFNFYSPDFSPVGALRDAGLVAPEFGITTTTSITTATNKLFSMIFARWDAQSSIDITPLINIADDAEKLLDELNVVFLSGAMSEQMRGRILASLAKHSDGPEERARDALYLVISSAEYAIQR